MRVFLQGALVVGIFLATNVVAAGVVFVLGLLLERWVPGWDSPWPWFVIGGAGAFAAYVWLLGAIAYLGGRALIQWRPSRRGG